jgi:hypothetical protein
MARCTIARSTLRALEATISTSPRRRTTHSTRQKCDTLAPAFGHMQTKHPVLQNHMPGYHIIWQRRGYTRSRSQYFVVSLVSGNSKYKSVTSASIRIYFLASHGGCVGTKEAGANNRIVELCQLSPYLGRVRKSLWVLRASSSPSLLTY